MTTTVLQYIRYFDFDVTDDQIPLKATLVALKELVDLDYDTIAVDPAGPGGGWPNITVYCMTEESADKVRKWLIKGHIAWTDEKGETFDDHCSF